MAKIEREFAGDFGQVLAEIEHGILSGSVSATIEDKSDVSAGNVSCAVRVFERYSWAGGSQATFFKINTFGEEAFLEKFSDVLNSCEGKA